MLEVFENGEATLSKTPQTGGAVTVGTVSEQLVYEVLDPANYLTADVVSDVSQIKLYADLIGGARIVKFSSTASSADEDAGTVNIQVTLLPASLSTVTVPYTVSGSAEGGGSRIERSLE